MEGLNRLHSYLPREEPAIGFFLSNTCKATFSSLSTGQRETLLKNVFVHGLIIEFLNPGDRVARTGFGGSPGRDTAAMLACVVGPARTAVFPRTNYLCHQTGFWIECWQF